jgi:methylmalonyl-CoA mutase, C-terminal domain
MKIEWLSTMPCTSKIGVDAVSTPSCRMPRCCGRSASGLGFPLTRRVGRVTAPSGYMTRCAAIQLASIATPDASRGHLTGQPGEPVDGIVEHGASVLRHYAGSVASDALDLSGVDLPGPPHQSSAPLRIVVAKPGLDGHDRGAKIVARALRDAGMEVIYTGLHQTPEQIVRTALAEDADAIGLSVLSGAHLTLFARLMELLKAEHADDIVVFGGGIIPEADRALLAEMGVAAVFTPGSTMAEVVEWVQANVPKGSSATT